MGYMTKDLIDHLRKVEEVRKSYKPAPVATLFVGESAIARCFYYFFMIVVVITYKTKATARRALTFVVRIFVNDTIAIAVWTSFHVCVCLEVEPTLMTLHMSSCS